MNICQPAAAATHGPPLVPYVIGVSNLPSIHAHKQASMGTVPCVQTAPPHASQTAKHVVHTTQHEASQQHLRPRGKAGPHAFISVHRPTRNTCCPPPGTTADAPPLPAPAATAVRPPAAATPSAQSPPPLAPGGSGSRDTIPSPPPQLSGQHVQEPVACPHPMFTVPAPEPAPHPSTPHCCRVQPGRAAGCSLANSHAEVVAVAGGHPAAVVAPVAVLGRRCPKRVHGVLLVVVTCGELPHPGHPRHVAPQAAQLLQPLPLAQPAARRAVPQRLEHLVGQGGKDRLQPAQDTVRQLLPTDRCSGAGPATRQDGVHRQRCGVQRGRGPCKNSAAHRAGSAGARLPVPAIALTKRPTDKQGYHVCNLDVHNAGPPCVATYRAGPRQMPPTGDR